MNVTRPPLTDARVRRALALAIDRDQLARAMGADLPPARSFAPPNGADFAATPQFKDDPGTARELLAAAGFPDGKGLKPLDFLVPNRGHARLTAEIVQEMWRKQLGVQVTFNVQEWGVYIDSENSGQFDVCYDGWNMSDPFFFYDLNRSGNPMSRYLWSNTEYDDTLRLAARAATIPARHAAYLHMEEILAREMPVIPLHFENVTFLLHPAVRGWHPNWPNNHPWKFLSLEPK